MDGHLIRINEELRTEIKRLNDWIRELRTRIEDHDHELHILRRYARRYNDPPFGFNKIDSDYRKETGYNH